MHACVRYALTLFVTLPWLSSCSSGSSATDATGRGDMALRVYAVPAESTDRLRTAIAESLRVGNDKAVIGSVSSPAPGQLLVLAPAPLQESIGSALQALASADKGASAPAAPYRVQFWVVDALRGDGADDGVPAEIAAAIGEARKQFGAVHFALRDAVSTVSRRQTEVSKQWLRAAPTADAPAPIGQLHYRLSGEAEGLSLDLHFEEQLPAGTAASRSWVTTRTDTTLPLRPGQVVVLSQSPAPETAADARTAPVRLYLVRADAMPAG